MHLVKGIQFFLIKLATYYLSLKANGISLELLIQHFY